MTIKLQPVVLQRFNLSEKKKQKERKYPAFLLNHFETQVKMSLLWKACYCSEKLEAQF